MSRIRSSEPKQSSADYFTGENALRMNSLAREIRQLYEEDRFSASEKGSCSSALRSDPSRPAGQLDGEDPSREGSETMSSADYFSETSSYLEPNRISAPHLKIGKYIKKKVLRVKNLDKNCASVLLQNRFLYENQEPYSSMFYSNDANAVRSIMCTFLGSRRATLNCRYWMDRYFPHPRM